MTLKGGHGNILLGTTEYGWIACKGDTILRKEGSGGKLRLVESILLAVHTARELSPTNKHVAAVMNLHRPETFSELAKLCYMSITATRRACETLKEHGWLIVDDSSYQHRLIVTWPEYVQVELARAFEEEYSLSPNRGEFLGKLYLELLIPDRNYVDNARPPFIINPQTDKPLEYDRLFIKKLVAFEHNGLQHFGPTEMFPDVDQFKDLRTRDLVKMSLSQENGITLVIFTYQDLSLAKMAEKIPPQLSKNPVDTNGLFIKTLERYARAYRNNVSRVENKNRKQAQQGK